MHEGWFKDKGGLAMRSCGAERGVVEGGWFAQSGQKSHNMTMYFYEWPTTSFLMNGTV